MVYNALLWFVNRTNSNPNILPDTRIELVPFNSKLDRGTSLTGALRLIEQHNVSAIIGESNSRNTVTMAVAAAVNNVLTCANLATTPQLSVKVDYPTIFRTQSTAVLQARSMLALMRHFNRTSFGIFSSNDEFGTGVTQSLQLLAPFYGLTVSISAVYDINKPDLRADLQALLDSRVQTIALIAAQLPVVTVFAGAKALGMLAGDHWWITTTGWTEGMFTTLGAQELLDSVKGVWQVQTPLYEDSVLYPDGSNEEAVALRTGTGNMCTGDSNMYLEGYLSLFALNTKFQVIRPTDFMHNTMKCAKILVGMFDYYTKTGKITVEGINERRLPLLANVSKLINDANLVDSFGNHILMDANGDLQMDQDILNYRLANVSSQKSIVCAKFAGRWNRTSDTVTLQQSNSNSSDLPYIFNGGKTGPPPLPEVPKVDYKAMTWLRYMIDGVVVLCVNFTLVLGIYLWTKANVKIFKAASPAFLGIILLGANISYLAIFVYSLYPVTDITCISFIWLKYLGFALVFGALLVKTHRIHLIFDSTKRNHGTVPAIIPDSVLGIYLAVFLLIWCGVLVAWSLLPSQRPRRVFVHTIALKSTALSDAKCSGGGGGNVAGELESINYLCVGLMTATLVGAALLAYAVRRAPSAFNESKWIAIGIYNWAVLGISLVRVLPNMPLKVMILTVPTRQTILSFIVKDPDLLYVMEAMQAILTQTVVAAVLFLPKIQTIRRGRGNEVMESLEPWDNGSHKLPSTHFLAASMLLSKATPPGKTIPFHDRNHIGSGGLGSLAQAALSDEEIRPDLPEPGIGSAEKRDREHHRAVRMAIHHPPALRGATSRSILQLERAGSTDVMLTERGERDAGVRRANSIMSPRSTLPRPPRHGILKDAERNGKGSEARVGVGSNPGAGEPGDVEPGPPAKPRAVSYVKLEQGVSQATPGTVPRMPANRFSAELLQGSNDRGGGSSPSLYGGRRVEERGPAGGVRQKRPISYETHKHSGLRDLTSDPAPEPPLPGSERSEKRGSQGSRVWYERKKSGQNEDVTEQTPLKFDGEVFTKDE
ncbi:hypothetical protein HDU96_003100 [Phlyctochytrium bullatum]|nr:hypothetical protein HDU96_003100 [Phlyctochytrium bullatum]